MRIFFGIYMVLVASMFWYVGIVCIRKKRAPAAGVLGILIGVCGLFLGALVLSGVI
ncbi:hypothetical protein [uncultured Dysosmobacter sp.]|uniref:hypothetical protein n=1 Tax=uncultured Dysosmobacter sp. TaxID=2591384 RepID=UPI002602E324|nr:hypothetical protein [uncultured Dysosmobacter sp.]